MSRKKSSNIFGYTHVKKTHKKRPGCHIKRRNKKDTYKKTRGQGRA